MTDRYAAEDLVALARELLEHAGMETAKASVVAELLVEADLMGHTTHGLQLCGPYLGDIEAGRMTLEGEPVTKVDRGASVVWDGRHLSGVWLTATAVDLAIERASELGVATIAIRRAHHIACLAAYLPRATKRGCMAIVACSDPSVASVAPYGGLDAVFTPDPVAAGIPTDGEPILVDISASITTNGLAARLRGEGRRLPHPWLQDAVGRETDDPDALFADPPGTILPIGGLEYGHKGYGLALVIEALTQGLAGYGRADAPSGWGASVFVQVIDPNAFGGVAAFTRQTSWTAAASREVRPRPGVERVRLPGERALARKRTALQEGVSLYPGIVAELAKWAERLGVRVPRPLD
jgi:LDH2 family malate/lactate/ureidoglycolate dehydrogenase